MKRLLSLVIVGLVSVVVLSSAFAGDITANGIFQKDLYTFLSNVKTVADKARLQSINRVLGNAMVASKTTSLGIATFSWLYNGVAYSKDSNASFSLTASAQATSTYNIYLFSIDIAGTASATKGIASSTLAGVTWPSAPAGNVPFSYLIIKAGNVNNFTLGASVFGTASETTFFSVGVIASAGFLNNVNETTTSDLSLTRL